MASIILHPKTRGKLSRKDKFINFVLDHIAKDVSSKDLERRKRAKERYMRHLEKNKISKREAKEWLKSLPHRKAEIAQHLAGGVSLAYPASLVLSSMPTPATPYAVSTLEAIGPYAVPLLAVGIGSSLAYDLWHLPNTNAVKKELRKLGKWTEHEIDMIVAHLKHHKKKNPKLFHGVRKHHVKKLHKVM